MVDFNKLREKTAGVKTGEAPTPGPGGVIAPTTSGAMVQSRPSFVPRDSAGTEHITKEDMQLPRLALAQKQSPQLDENNGKYIPGLKQGDLFNTLTKEIYGRGPIEFYIIRADKPRYIEFYPLTAGGGVKDINVAPTDPRTQFTTDAKGESVPPVATKFYDFVIVPLPLHDPDNVMASVMALSMKSSGIKVARQLNSLIKSRKAAIFACRYALGVVSETNKKGTYYNFKVEYLGWPDSEATYNALKQAHDTLKDKTLDIDRDNSDDEGGTTDPDAPGAEKEI
jgi:hypothetical protein